MIKSNRKLVLALALGVAIASPAAFAGNFYVTGGASYLDPSSDTDGSSETRPSLGLGYSVNDAWAVELNGNLGSYEHTMSHSSLGGNYASMESDLVDLSAIYNFQNKSSWTPYLGLGVARASFDNPKLLGVSVGSFVSLKSDTAPLVRAGVDYGFTSNWFARGDVSYSKIDTRASFMGAQSDSVDVDPVRATLSVGYRFK